MTDANVILTSVTCNTSIGTLASPAYVSHGTPQVYALNFITPPLPSSLNVGDLMVALLFENATNPITCSSTDWSCVIQKTGGPLDRVAIFWKIYQSGDTSPTFSYLNNLYCGGVYCSC